MSDEYTPKLALTKPDVGASDDTWGNKLNVNFDILDASITPVSELGEIIDDRVASLLRAGPNVTLTYDDTADTLTIASSGGGGSGGGASVTISLTPPDSPVAGNLWFENDTGILYIYYTDPTPNSYWVALTTLSNGGNAPWDAAPLMDSIAAPGVSAFFARGDHVHPSDTSKASTTAVTTEIATKAVRYDTAQVITEAQQTTARKNIYAAPFDAMAYSGMQINGSMEVSQQYPITTPVISDATATTYACDGWAIFNNATGSMYGTVYGSNGFPGIPNYVQLTFGTSLTFGSSQRAQLYQLIEGYRVARLNWGSANAQPLTLGFWVAHSLTGIYSIAVNNFDGSRCYTATYTQNVSNAQEYKTVTIPGCIDGVWNKTNGVGISLSFCIGTAANLISPAANTWYSTIYVAAPGQVNAGTAGASLNFSGVVVLPGIEAPTAARAAFIMRPFDQELVTCRRYWQKSYDYSVRPGTVNSAGVAAFYLTGLSGLPAGGHVVSFGISMRAAPSVIGYSPNTGAANKAQDAFTGDVAVTTDMIGERGFRWLANSAAANQYNLTLHWTASARL